MINKIAGYIAVTRRFGISLRTMAFLVFLQLLSIGFEMIGIGMLLPVFEKLRSGMGGVDPDQSGLYWRVLKTVYEWLGIPITLGSLLAVSFVFILLRQIFSYWNARFNGVIMKNAADRIRRRCFNGILKAQTTVQQRIRVGEVAGDLTVELDRAIAAIFGVLRTFGYAVQVSLYVAGLFVLSVPMTLISLGVLIVVAFLIKDLVAGVKQTAKAISSGNVQLTAFIVERLMRVRLIRLSGMENAEGAAFAVISRRQAEQTVRQKLIATRMTLLPEPIVIAFGYLVLFVGGQIFSLDLASLALFVIVLIRLMPIMKSVLTDYNAIIGRWASLERVDHRLSEVMNAREEKGGNRTFERLDRDIAYEHVSFSYTSDDTPALSEVTIKLPAHRMSALIGPSGAGKSTFIDLLPRLRDPTAGEIRFDGVPIAEFSMDSLRAGIAFVPQQPQIFNISAADYIRYGKEDATDEEVGEAARLAGALDFIQALPQGFDTLLGDGGQRLSGGQRQRLDIARALVRRAPILILDEPTSALDAEAEATFRDALSTLRSETRLTIIVIAHRLSTIMDADKIIVLKHGRVEAAGSHDELMASGGWFSDAYREQQKISKSVISEPATSGSRINNRIDQ
ncbi:MAG: ABC transporter ATP-binding protein [Candidatus Binatia bacterium]